MGIYPRTWVEVDLENIKDNVKKLKALTRPPTFFMAVVKANGYGHGAVEVANAALEAGGDRLGVAIVEEARVLREAGINAPIHLLTGFEAEQVESIIELDLIPAVYTEQHLNALGSIEKTMTIHIKVDTGMGRIGLKPENTIAFIKKTKENKNLKIEGIFTHLATADEAGSEYADKQISTFKNLIKDIKDEGLDIKINHIANSAATILRPETHLQMVRVGIALYGLHPSDDTKGKIDLKPALSWYSRLSYVKNLEQGEAVSYGATHIIKEASAIGTVPVGYADGYNRSLSNKANVLVSGIKIKQVGRVCMDQFMVELNGIDAKENEKVTLIGKQNDAQITADEMAKEVGTINYEVVCAIADRVKRYYEPV